MSILTSIGGAIAARLVPVIEDTLKMQVEKYFPVLMEKLLALLPVLAAAAGKAVGDQLPNLVKAILAKDPDIPGISDVIDVSEAIRNGINGSIPDIDIPFISDVFKGITGFDLTDELNKRQ